ncbi:MAG: hypothetical protein Q7R77_02105 [Candidatus Daviesbacteria bacterium]|nr:hypothetical protein [Candidatus Daviesbacteria bacterium]
MKGLTLVEVLVAMGIATIVGGLLVVIIINSASLFSNQSSKIQAGLNINDTLSQIRGSIKQASAIANQYQDGPTTYTTGVNTLVLKVSSIDLSNNIIADTYDYFVFFKDQNFLRFKIFPNPHPASFRKAANQIFSNIVDSLTFQYFNSATPPAEVNPLDATTVKIILTLKQKVDAGFETHTATSEANLRND